MQGPYHVMLAFWPWILEGAIETFQSFEAILFLKISQFQKDFLVPPILPKNEQKMVELFLFIFWKHWKTPKKHFEIN